MRVLFASLRNTSHFLPLVPFIAACRAQGHEVAVAGPIDLQERVRVTGAAFFAVAHPGDEGLRPYWMRMRAAPEHERNHVVIAEIFAGACARAALPSLLEVAERWQPNVVVRESQEYASLVVAEHLRIPHARVGITTRRSELPLLSVAAGAVDVLRASIGCASDPRGEALLHESVLTLFPASFDDASVPAPVLRFRAERPSPSAVQLTNHWGENSDPFVYLSYGTVVGGMDVLRAAYATALEAVRSLPVRVLLTIGAELPVEALGEVPSNVHVERFVPQDEVLPHAAAVICHGGSGTVIGTLAAGVPMVVEPFFADQPSNAERVQELGVGLSLPTGTASVDQLRDALQRVLAEPTFTAAAKRVSAEIASLAPMANAAAEIARMSTT